MVVVCESDIKLTVVMNGRDLIINLSKKKSTIKDLKLAVCEKFGIPVDQQIYSNKKPTSPLFFEIKDDVLATVASVVRCPGTKYLHLSLRDPTLQWCVFSVYDGRFSNRIGPEMFKFHKLDTVQYVKREILTKTKTIKRGARIEHIELTQDEKVWEDHQNLFQCQMKSFAEVQLEGDVSK